VGVFLDEETTCAAAVRRRPNVQHWHSLLLLCLQASESTTLEEIRSTDLPIQPIPTTIVTGALTGGTALAATSVMSWCQLEKLSHAAKKDNPVQYLEDLKTHLIDLPLARFLEELRQSPLAQGFALSVGGGGDSESSGEDGSHSPATTVVASAFNTVSTIPCALPKCSPTTSNLFPLVPFTPVVLPNSLSSGSPHADNVTSFQDNSGTSLDEIELKRQHGPPSLAERLDSRNQDLVPQAFDELFCSDYTLLVDVSDHTRQVTFSYGGDYLAIVSIGNNLSIAHVGDSSEVNFKSLPSPSTLVAW